MKHRLRPMIACLVALTLLCLLNTGAIAASIGTIEVQQVFREYKKTQDAQSKLSEKEKELKKKMEEGQEKIEKARREGKKQAEIEALTKKLDGELEPKRKELLALNEQLTGQIQAAILKAVEEVGKNLGIDLVLDKQVVITGGVNLTEMVIKKLNK